MMIRLQFMITFFMFICHQALNLRVVQCGARLISNACNYKYGPFDPLFRHSGKEPLTINIHLLAPPLA